ncbi:Hypothetical protein CINCED_3A006665 [Cinara cedri]|uniref:Uncharacterized protein n=1 Tax=Cinara cedri TaxID=506608 RepID=A0A5E4N7P4_9HEMI|nr:Hypothetical protein CINCED_3A006665 [Cinara cedri]
MNWAIGCLVASGPVPNLTMWLQDVTVAVFGFTGGVTQIIRVDSHQDVGKSGNLEEMSSSLKLTSIGGSFIETFIKFKTVVFKTILNIHY